MNLETIFSEQNLHNISAIIADTNRGLTKSELERHLREISGLNYDGNELFQNAFATKNPYIILNMLATESEQNGYNGLKELLISSS